MGFAKVSGCLNCFLQYAVVLIYATLKLFLTSLMLVKNNFRRLPRRAYGTARNDDIVFRQPEN
ncbi:MAG: hypothetical protein IKG79_04070 [Neisseriaceae bacterium]|nr:hypothetical protein [Neisseriaceae bacterium]